MCDCQWRDIETAPKDGRSILLLGEGKVTLGGWMSEVDQGADYEGQGVIAPGWWSVDLSDNEPTHWMPLPDPPKADPVSPSLPKRKVRKA